MFKHIRVVALAAAFGVAVGCSGSSPNAPTEMSSSGATISGLVTGGGSGLTAAIAGTNLSASVDAAGRFELSNVRAGNIQLQFRGGSTSASTPLPGVADGQFIELQVQLDGASAAIVSDVRSAKVILCHSEGNGSYHSIDVSVNAESAHRAHGDAKIGEPVPASPTMKFDESCRPVGPRVELMKATNGNDANEAPGPKILVGDPVTWTYVVSNTGTIQLTAIAVTDDKVATVSCPATTLAAGASLTCTATGVAVLGPYTNIGTVTANWTMPGSTPPSGTVTDTDTSHYLGVTTLDDEDEGPKVSLCHKTGNGSYHLITVSVNAEPAHRGHGDAKPGESVPGQSGKTFSPSCGIQ